MKKSERNHGFLLLVLSIMFASFQNATAAFAFISNTYSVGHAPNSVAAADINGDGSLDLISANSADNTLTILTNKGNGTFGSNATLSVGIGPTCVIAADLRAVGKADLICANYGGGGGRTLTVLTNNGNGVFGSNVTLTAGLGPVSLAVGSLSDNGKLDLVCANAGTNGNGTTLTVFTNNGNGLLVSNLALTVGSDPFFVTTAEVNGDGKVDLICANVLGSSLTVLTNKGNGRFATSVTATVGNTPYCVAAADVNGDGKTDLISANTSGNTLTVVTNNGHGGFTVAATLSLGSPVSGPILPLYVIAPDLNGDGKTDVVCVNATNAAHGVGAIVVFTNSASYRLSSNTTNDVGVFAVCIIAADVNADGKPDLVTVNQNANTLSVLINTNAFVPSAISPVPNLKSQSKGISVYWPSGSPGWTLQEVRSLKAANWLPSGYSGFPIVDDGTNKSLTVPILTGGCFFRLLHP